MPTLSEAEVEAIMLQEPQEARRACLSDAVSGPDGSAPERDACCDTVLPRLMSGKVRGSEVECAAAEVA